MAANVWTDILSRVETKVNRHSFYTWFKPTVFVAEADQTVRVRVPNPLFRDWLTKHYAGVISEAMTEINRDGMQISFVIAGEPVQHTNPPPASKPAPIEDTPPIAGGRRRGVSIRVTPSARSSSDPRTSSRAPPLRPSPRRRRVPTTRSSSTAASGSVRLT